MTASARVAHPGLPSPYLGSLLVALLCLVVPIYFLGETRGGGSYEAWPAALAVAVVAGARYAVVVAGSRIRPFEMSFWLFVYVFLGLAPLVQLRTATLPPTTPIVRHREYDETAMAIVLAGVALTLIGSVIAARRMKTGGDVKEPARRLSPGRVGILATAVLALAAGYTALVGLGPLFSDRATLNQVRLAALGGDYTNVSLASATVSMGLAVSAIAQVHLRRQRKRDGEPAPLLMLLTTILMLLACVNPISSPRFVVGTVLLGLVAGMGLISTPRRFRTVGVVGIAALVLVFPILDAFRGSDVAYIGSVSPVDTLSESDYDAYNQIVNTVNYVDVNGIAAGRQALGVVLFWVPRAIWAGKPQDTGIELGEFMGYNFTNLSAPLFAEFFINGGWLLLVIGATLTGVVLRRLDVAVGAQIRGWGLPSVALCLLPFYALIILRGSLLQSMLYLAVIVIASWFVYEPRPTRRAGRAQLRPAAKGSVRR